MHKNRGMVYYGDYLNLPQFLATQNPLSKKYGQECHDEMLFIVVHQAYELWFKQILHDLDSIISVFQKEPIAEASLASSVQKLNRIKKIQGLLIHHFDVLETMTPMDFLEFRELLLPASGFQSVQFREIEIKLGLGIQGRLEADREYFIGRLNEPDLKRLTEVEKQISLTELIERWLERTPFTNYQSFNFWGEYQIAVNEMLQEDANTINKNQAGLSPQEQALQLENINQSRLNFDSLFNLKTHEELVKAGKRHYSQKALLNALFILVYRDEPLLSHPFELITSLMDLDENFTSWRYRHALLAQRMLGNKIGTGGSSGHTYLKRAAEHNRVFTDFFNLSTFLIPRSKLPKLPAFVKQKLEFSAG